MRWWQRLRQQLTGFRVEADVENELLKAEEEAKTPMGNKYITFSYSRKVEPAVKSVNDVARATLL